MNFFLSKPKKQQSEYTHLLQIVGSLSKLFSESNIPYLYYRATENIFCRSFETQNIGRKDCSYDAKEGSLGIGIKTFILKKNYSTEKVAEFNKLSASFKEKTPKQLAYLLADYRNARMNSDNKIYGITESIYHCIGRAKQTLYIFETSYPQIDKDKIKDIKAIKGWAGITFTVGNDFYKFNYSKSTLYRRFETPSNALKVNVNILDDPYGLLTSLSNQGKLWVHEVLKHEEEGEFVILPLYSTQLSKRGKKVVAPKSGLNQRNAGWRKRAPWELYVPVPKEVHKSHPGFFPDKTKVFKLIVPSGEEFNAKMCQQGNKGLMTNPNNALEKRLLRWILHLEEKEILTYDKLLKAGFDSLKVTKIKEGVYKVDVAYDDDYEIDN